ncbi:uncharacterized protein METZ01_LOCUS390429 [marine metagenome]|uniref:Fe2OG dioxygenase domain-containing protein n=1 Tax=marine metagenome TaxID=408172 RepID=A0A382UUX4_9ZZZZ
MNPLKVITFPYIFTQEQVREINKEIRKNISEKEPLGLQATSTKVGNFFHIPCLPLTSLLHPWLKQCQAVNKKVFGYDIFWNFPVESFNYNVYDKSGEYDWHTDVTKNKVRDIKLTCLLNLSEETYGGGEFRAIGKPNENIKFTSGMGLIFNPLIAHKVTPVTKGERITLTYWGVGPSWR